MKPLPMLEVIYSPEFERERILSTLEDAGWLREHGYTPTLPGNMSLDDATNADHHGLLLEQANSEYDSSLYEDASHQVQAQWRSVCESLRTEVLTKRDLQLHPSYTVYLTQYGVGGSYELPKTIIFNIRRRALHDAGKILLHEIVHLSIEHLIQRHQISHWQKERLVDQLCTQLLPNNSMKQNLPREATHPVDDVLARNDGTVEEIIADIATTAHQRK